MKRREAGYTLAEVIISMLLAAIMASAVFKLAVTSVQSGVKLDRKVVAQQAQRHLTDQLTQYVTGDNTNANTNMPVGPNNGYGAGAWRLSGITGEDNRAVTDSCGCYALSANGGAAHVLSGYLPQWFEQAPYNATISYVVTDGPGGLASGQPKGVLVTVTWVEP